MNRFKKIKLSHRPLDEPLPLIHHRRILRKWSAASLPQRTLVQELNQLNHDLKELRRQQENLLTANKLISNYKPAGHQQPDQPTINLHHLPQILASPEKLSFYDLELAGVDQELVDLQQVNYETGLLVVKTASNKNLTEKNKEFSENKNYRLAANKFKGLNFKQLSTRLEASDPFIPPVKAFSKLEPHQEPATLVEKLRYGIIELQEKWSEVQNKLQTVNYLSPEANQQLKQLEQQLNLLENVAIESPHIIKTLPKIPGAVRNLTDEQRSMLQKELLAAKEKISAADAPSYDQLYIEEYLREIDSQTFPKTYLSKSLSKPGKVMPLSSRRIKKIHQQVLETINEFNTKPYQQQLNSINQQISKNIKVKSGFKIRHLSPYQPNEKFAAEFFQQKQKLKKHYQNFFFRKTKKLQRIEKQLVEIKLPHYRLISKMPSPGQVKPINELQRKKLKKELAKNLDYQQDKKIVKKLKKLHQELLNNYSPEPAKVINTISRSARNQNLLQNRLTDENLTIEKSTEKRRKMSIGNIEKARTKVIPTPELLEIEQKLAEL